MFCVGCGNDFDGDSCSICKDRLERDAYKKEQAESKQEARERSRRRLCTDCGNAIERDASCLICESQSVVAQLNVQMVICRSCGNETPDELHCAVCKSGHGKGNHASVCPQCDVALVDQDWEGVTVLQCGECSGTFFPPRALETTLDKLRAACEGHDFASVVQEFKDRYRRSIPQTLRYKGCPVCGEIMVRRNYARVSGVIIDVCGPHGIWVDQAAFGGLTDFVSRGGEILR
jgi:Zn-finger nucleic acid-binding protein